MRKWIDKMEYTMLANKAKDPTGFWWVSEKLDGCRAIWDGGISTGLPCSQVPYACTEKHRKEKIATGLWSRYGQPIYAPEFMLAQLPKGTVLDGELYMGRGMFQATMSIVKKHNWTFDWNSIKYMVFDAPRNFFMDRTITKPKIYMVGVREWAIKHGWLDHGMDQQAEIFKLIETLTTARPCWCQNVVQTWTDDWSKLLDTVVSNNGEGLMLRRGLWTPSRCDTLLKVKPFTEDVAVVVGHTAGMGRCSGMMGALIVEWKGKTFELGTGFDDATRTNPPKVGLAVEFAYRGLTDDGIPREARYVPEKEA